MQMGRARPFKTKGLGRVEGEQAHKKARDPGRTGGGGRELCGCYAGVNARKGLG